MAGNLPLPAESFNTLPHLPIRPEALADFSLALDGQLAELRRRFFEPREHIVALMFVGRHAPKKPR